ncbi:phosphotransferase [Raineyella fluvialis]|uniref:Phosphotransferase n=2 Tax=Raineyella fluvialis TaxID=2662261 RepID=A0A5Q2FDE9_9ACTN|nr:phosphotransferase [Raineyella fluvialis]
MFEPAPLPDETSERQLSQQVAVRAAAAHGFGSAARIDLMQVSENATFLVTETCSYGDRSAVIRVHRPGSRDRDAIESELTWLDVLHDRRIVPAIKPLATATGERVLAFPVGGVVRYAVAFEALPGATTDEALLRPGDFRRLGRIAATLHESVRHIHRPITRFSWDWEHTLGDRARWGRWQDGPGMTPALVAEIEPALRLLKTRLAVYGRDAHRFGLIHADLRVSNLMEDADGYTVIDFDDCGFGWFMYDFAAAVSFLETDPRLCTWQEAWASGYREVRPLSRKDEVMLPSFVMMRRLMLQAWLGSHPDAAEAAGLQDTYAEGTAALAHIYLANAGRLFAAA